MAHAQQATNSIEPHTIDMSKCEAMTDAVRAIRCAVTTLPVDTVWLNQKAQHYVQQIKASAARWNAADASAAKPRARGAAADAFKACTDFMITGIKDNCIDRGKAFEMAGGKFAAENTCSIAVRFGYVSSTA